MSDYLIIGADAAGLSAAVQIKNTRPDASIKVINKGQIISYGACGIPYVLSGDITSFKSLIHFTPESFAEKRGIPVEINREALDIFPQSRRVLIKDLTNRRTYAEEYKKLLIATGAIPKKLPFLDYESEGVFDVHDIEDLLLILSFLERRNPQKVAIIGAGNIGLELAEAMHRKGKDVFLIEILETPVSNFPPLIQRAVLKKMKEKGINFLGSTTVKNIEKAGECFQIKTDDQELETDVIFSVAGIQPATGFCGDKIKKLKNGALVTDRRGQTSNKDIYAAGDCAVAYHRILKRNVYFPLGTTANRMGRIAGLNMAGRNIRFPGILGTQIFKFFELSLAKTGLNFNDIEKEGYEADSFSADRLDKAGYYPGALKASVEIVCERDTGRLLGASTVCEGNAAQFIDPAAVAVFCGMSVKDLGWFDTAYTPPYAPVWNALISAALKAVKT